MSKEELQAKLAKANAENKGMVVYPEYFKKKKKRMRPDFIKKLQKRILPMWMITECIKLVLSSIGMPL
ncbi:hypothetical protein [Bacteroides fragilis]|uniref:hypothetical protein n=1 Tax=Bacteroides fragilis TaxID=817 RepID=UPI000A6D584E|nr:hypothetical protein [Bacteroides fragilis]